MSIMRKRLLLTLFSLLLSPTILAAEAPDDFPTLERVEFVLGCLDRRSKTKQNYDALYGCVCALDYIRSQFSYSEYNEALTFSQLRSTPGERGSVFRDPSRAELLRDKLGEVEKNAEQRCFMAKSISAN